LYKKTFSILFLLILVTPLLPILQINVIPWVSAQPTDAVPFDSYHVLPVNNILYPRLAMPIFGVWGEERTIYLAPQSSDESLDGWSVSIYSKVSGNSYTLEVVNAEWVTDNRPEMTINRYIKLVVKFPDNVEKGLYNLIVERNGVYTEPNSIYVFGEAYPDKIVVGHISDTHLGPSGKPKYMKEDKYFWRAVSTLEAIGVDLIVVTGDFIDGSREESFHQQVYEWLSSLNIPIIPCMGNTDYSVIEGGKYHWEKYLAPNSGATRFSNILILSINSRNGDIPDPTVAWVESILEANIDADIKTYVWHYPVFSKDYNSEKLINKIAEWAEKYGLNLVLNGHFHTDVVKTPPETPATVIVTTSTATSKLYRGYRLVYLGSDGGISYDDASTNLFEKFVEYAQINDYSSVGQTAVYGGADDNFTLVVKLKDLGKEAVVEGGEKLAEYVADGRRTVLVKPSSPSGIIKIYQEEDTTPPDIKVAIGITVNEVTLKPIVKDYGLGVEDVVVYYSPDNSSWTEFTPKVEDEVKMFVMPTPEYKIFYYKVVAVDYAGNKAVLYGSKETGIEVPEEGGEVGGELPLPFSYIAIAVIAAVAIVLLVLWRMRK